jgi:hypothetical protein
VQQKSCLFVMFLPVDSFAVLGRSAVNQIFICAHRERQYCAGPSPDSIFPLARALVSGFFFCRQCFPLLFPDPCKLGAVFCLLLLISSFIARGGMPSTHFSFGLGIGLHPVFSNATGFGSDLALLLQLDLNPSSFLCSFECVHEPNQSSLCSV